MRNRNAMLFGAGALFLGLVAFVTAYVLRPGDAILTAQAPLEPPGPEALPTPGATPDPAQPFWYVPYVNADSKLPHFVGKLGPFTVNPGDPGYTPYDVCPAVGMDLVPPGELDRAVRTPGPFSIDLVRLDAGITQVQLPNAWRCKGTSALRDVHWMLHIRAGTPDVNKGGSPLTIHRVAGLVAVTHGAPAARWSTVALKGIDAIVASPVVVVGDSQFGSCFAAAYQPDTNVTTTVSADAANAPFCLRILEEVLA